MGITSGLRRRMSIRLWLWIHRLGYPMFVLFLVHAQLAGTDFSHTAVSLAGWATLGVLIMLTLPRLAGGRMAARAPLRVNNGPASAQVVVAGQPAGDGAQVS